MFASLVHQPAFWGFLGAFIYAAPRLGACIFESRGDNRHPLVFCIWDFVVALAVGIIAAELFGPWVQTFLKRDGPHELRAISGLIGLLANPVSPEITKRFKERVGTMIKGSGK